MNMSNVSEHEELALLHYLLNKYLGDKHNVIISCNESLIVGEMNYIEIPPTCYKELDVKMGLSRYKIFNEKGSIIYETYLIAINYNNLYV